MKPQSRTVQLHISHLENALASYLKPYFPEAVEIGGVDISIPVSRQDNTFEATVYITSKKIAKKETNSVEEVPTDSLAAPAE
jgi:LEA14-like dessication related protein